MGRRHRYSLDYEVLEKELQGKKKTRYQKELIYKGKYYILESKSGNVKMLKWISMLFMIVLACTFLFIGLLNNQGSRLLYVLLPYIIMFLPIYYGLIGSVKSLIVKDKMTTVEYEQSIVRIKKSSLSLFILAITSAIGQSIFVMRNLEGDRINLDIIFLIGIIIIMILALSVLRLQVKYQVREE